MEAPKVETAAYGDVPMLDVSASYDVESGNGAIFIVNRSQHETVVTDLVWQDGRPVSAVAAWRLAGNDPKAANTWENPNQITAQAIAAPKIVDGTATLALPPHSFTVMTTKIRENG